MDKPKVSDDLQVLSNEEMAARLKTCLDSLQSMATSHDSHIDSEILRAEQALRRAIKLIKSAA